MSLPLSESTVKCAIFSALDPKDDKAALWERLKERLERLRPDVMLTRKATEAEQLNKTLQYRPLGHHWNAI